MVRFYVVNRATQQAELFLRWYAPTQLGTLNVVMGNRVMFTQSGMRIEGSKMLSAIMLHLTRQNYSIVKVPA